MEPYDTIGAITLGVLLFVYVIGLPATLIVAAVYWPSRTRGQLPTAYPAAGQRAHPVPPAGWVSPAAQAPPGEPPPTSPALAPSPVSPAFLRLQALEREVLALRDAPAPADTYRRLAAEAVELLGRYGTESTVGQYTAGLLAIIDALSPPELAPADPPPPPELPPARPPDRLRVGLARFAAAGRPIPPDWAYAWLGHLPDREAVWAGASGREERGPAPARLWQDQLARCFAHRYAEAYPHGGMILPAGGAQLWLTYTPASARFGGQPIELPTSLPEVAEQPDALHRLRRIGAAAVADLRLS